MNDLEMIKDFAELEGVEIVRHMRSYVRKHQSGDLSICGVQFAEYNPITDLALNCAARDKYLVTILHSGNWHQISVKGFIEYIDVDNAEGIPRAVIECILKSEGALEMINIHWMTKRSLSLLLNSGELYRGKSGKIKIKTHSELQGQVIRESVWTEESSVICELRKEGEQK